LALLDDLAVGVRPALVVLAVDPHRHATDATQAPGGSGRVVLGRRGNGLLGPPLEATQPALPPQPAPHPLLRRPLPRTGQTTDSVLRSVHVSNIRLRFRLSSEDPGIERATGSQWWTCQSSDGHPSGGGSSPEP